MNNIIAIALLGAHQLPLDVARTIALETVPSFNTDDAESGLVTIGYDSGDRRVVTAEMLLPTLADAEALLADRDRVASLIAQGVRAMPASRRPALPGWIADSADARRAESMRRRASAAANAAIAQDVDLPWAA